MVDPDGTLRTARFINEWSSGPQHRVRVYRTVDGSLIDISVLRHGSRIGASATLPNGTTYEYWQQDGSALHATSVTDVHANMIEVRYRNSNGPQIDRIVDTLGRVVEFRYDREGRQGLLTSLVDAATQRPLVHFRYSSLTIRTQDLFRTEVGGSARVFVGDCPIEHPRPPAPPCRTNLTMLEAVVDAGSKIGWWFGDGSYSRAYGVLRRYQLRRGMRIDTPVPDLGRLTLQRFYNYPVEPSMLADVPAYTEMTERWVSRAAATDQNSDFQEATYRYSTEPSAFASTVEYPDGSNVRRTAYTPADVASGAIGGVGLPATEEHRGPATEESLGGRPLFLSIRTHWEEANEQGYRSPRIKSIIRTDARRQNTTTEFVYGPWHNQVKFVIERGHDGRVLRTIETDYEQREVYRQRHLFNLPTRVTVHAGEPGRSPVVAITETEYDAHARLHPAPATVGRAPSILPGPERGLPTAVRRYGDPVTRDPAQRQDEFMEYDELGNLIRHTGSACCEAIEYVYETTTHYAWPSRIVRGSADPASPLRVQEAFAYDLRTGLIERHTDEDGRVTRLQYDPGSLRLLSRTFVGATGLRTPPSEVHKYDPATLTLSTRLKIGTDWEGGLVATESVVVQDGLGRVIEARSRAADGTWDRTTAEYDALGRLRRQTLPARAGSSLPSQAVSHEYDPLGRLIATKVPGGGTSLIHYEEAARPPGASAEPGATIRTTDPDGLERWTLRDALGRVREVAEPDPAGDGRVTIGTPLITRISYSGLATRVEQERRVVAILTDGLGRVTHHALPGREAVIRGPGGRIYSDAFDYDGHARVRQRRGAGGDGPIFVYDSDPLRRLQRIERSGPRPPSRFPLGSSLGLSQPASLPGPTTTIAYVTQGDLRRPHRIVTEGVVEEVHAYDREARLASVTRVFDGRADRPFELGYGYDAFGRLIEMRYPARHGERDAPRRAVGYEFGRDGRPSLVRVDRRPFATDMRYDAAGRLAGITLAPHGSPAVREAYSYYPSGALRNFEINRAGRRLASADYLYSAAGRATAERDADPAFARGYTYDGLGRLRAADGHRPAAQGGWTQTYGYDRQGGRTGVMATGTLPDGSAVPADGLSQLAFDTATGRITSPGFAYDAAGNMTLRPRPEGRLTLGYDQDGRLSRATLLGPSCETPICPGDLRPPVEGYRYGADRRRLLTEVGHLQPIQAPAPPTLAVEARAYHIWSGNAALAEFAETPAGAAPEWVRERIFLGQRLLATVEPRANGADAIRLQHPGRLHSRLVTGPGSSDAVGNNVLPYGTPIATGSGGPPPDRRFSTYERSGRTGLDYAINRFYDPQTGRFTQPDPLDIGGITEHARYGLNTYAYANNEPVNSMDPLGLRAIQVPDPACPPSQPPDLIVVCPYITIWVNDAPRNRADGALTRAEVEAIGAGLALGSAVFAQAVIQRIVGPNPSPTDRCSQSARAEALHALLNRRNQAVRQLQSDAAGPLIELAMDPMQVALTPASDLFWSRYWDRFIDPPSWLQQKATEEIFETPTPVGGPFGTSTKIYGALAPFFRAEQAMSQARTEYQRRVEGCP
jgi:RHS repeat-associated protein